MTRKSPLQQDSKSKWESNLTAAIPKVKDFAVVKMQRSGCKHDF